MKINLLASRLNGVLVLAFATLLFSCSQLEPFSLENDDMLRSSSTSGPYNVELTVSPLEGGNYAWVWKITNPNPGNGTGGTIQDLSHWNISMGICAQVEDITYAGYSNDGGESYESLPIEVKTDPSIADCSTAEVFKFDRGTDGSTSSYYKLIVNKNFAVDETLKAYYKSGGNTACGSFTFPGFGCEAEKECFDWIGETATGDGITFSSSSTWFMWNNYTTNPIDLIAGQDKDNPAGTISMSPKDGQVEITVTLKEGWRFKDNSEALKVLAYDNQPTVFDGFGRSVANIRYMKAEFDGNIATILVPVKKWYFIHADVEQLVETECEVAE